MKKIILVVIIILNGCQKDNKYEIDIRFETPEKTLHTYWTYLNSRNYKDALGCFLDFVPEQYDSSLIYPLPPSVDSLVIDSILQIKTISKKAVLIYYRVKFYSKKDGYWKYYNTGDKLVLTKTGWKIKDVIIPK